MNYRVVLKRDGDEFEIGSIGIQHGAAWAWDIDAVGSFYPSLAQKGPPGGGHALEGGLPAPYRPTMPRTSPALTENVTQAIADSSPQHLSSVNSAGILPRGWSYRRFLVTA